MLHRWLRSCAVVLALLLAFSLVAWLVPRALDPTAASPERRARDRRWVDSSPYFWDRTLCRWASLCGLHHLRRDPAVRPASPRAQDADAADDDAWGELRRRDGAAAMRRRPARELPPRRRRRLVRDVPAYVVRHAPLVHLYSGEQFWPSDMAEHVAHMTARIDDVALNASHPWTLRNLDRLNAHRRPVVLHSRDDVETRPDWLHSRHNVPAPFPPDRDGGTTAPQPDADADADAAHTEPTTWFDVDREHPLRRIAAPRRRTHPPPPPPPPPGEPRFSRRGHRPDADGRSRAPAVLVLVDKGSGILDAFWFFFYSYNLGQTVLGIRFGNHVGDWEHCMVRFEHGRPRGLYFSEHEGGQAYAWPAVEKRGDRPVIYSALGSHAMYALPGDHPYILPFGLLKDVTDRGPLWDPALNNYAYHYDDDDDDGDDGDGDDDDKASAGQDDADADAHSLVPAASNPHAPTSWFHYAGRWGDDVYALADRRQWRLFGQYHYVAGPTGPKFKRLDRAKLCRAARRPCRLRRKLDPKSTWY